MTTTRETRPGVTLLEVLVAIFVVAIGLLALLTLFPLGALRMGQALKDDRTTQAALNADSILRTQWRGLVVQPLRDDTLTDPAVRDTLGRTHPDPLIWAMDDPNLLFQRKSPSARRPGLYENHYPPVALRHPALVTIPSPGPISPTSLVGDVYAPPETPPIEKMDPAGNAYYVTVVPRTNKVASYPVLIDPLGYLARLSGNSAQRWVGGAVPAPNFIPIPRRNLSTSTVVQPPALPDVGFPPPMDDFGARQNCCLVDDFSFQPNGAANNPTDLSNPSGLIRQGRYSWAAVVQRPDNTVRDVVTLKVLVFDGRPPLLATPGDEVVIRGVTIDATNRRSITLPGVPNRGTDQIPLIRKGGWIMDGTIFNDPTNPNNSIRHANFHRIVGVTEGTPDAATNTTPYTLDLETEILGTFPNGATIYLFAGLAEVFERPPLQPDPAQ